MHAIFYVQIKISLCKSSFFWLSVKNLYALMFRWADTILLWKWLKIDTRKSKRLLSGFDGCHMSRENVIKFQVALYPSFPDAFRSFPSRTNALDSVFSERSDLFFPTQSFLDWKRHCFSKSLAEFAWCIMHVRKFASPLQSELRHDVTVRLCCVIKIFRNNSK